MTVAIDGAVPDPVNGSEPVNGKVTGTQAISRAFAVLHLFRDRGADFGVVQVASELGLSLSTAHRIIRALVAEGYLRQNSDDRYDLGTAAFLLGQSAQRYLGLDVVRPVLERLSEQTGESVNLGLLDGSRALVALRVESPHPLRFSQTPGTQITLYATSLGKSLLAFNPALHDALPPRLAQLTPKTHRSVESLRRDLAEVRTRGWSIDDEESLLGVRCVAAPVLDRRGEAQAAVAVQAPAVRMPDARFAEIGPLVVSVAHEIAAVLPPAT